MTLREEALNPSETIVEGMKWEEFLDFFKKNWIPGQHMALVATTGQGKSTFAVQVLSQRKYVLAFDPKGGDDTLAASGFQRVTDWPLPGKVWEEIEDDKPARLIIGGKGWSTDQLRPLFKKVLDDVAKNGKWTLYVDEFQITADRRFMDLAKEVEALLITARFKMVSVVTAYQAPSWVPTASTRQASWVIVWPTKDEDSIKKLAEKSGRNKIQIKRVIDSLPPYHCLIIPPKHTDPMIITTAPKIS
jgi:hypothetical protein